MEEREVFDLIIQLGETLLSNGGEIFRTNEVMSIAAQRFGLEEFNAFILANGVFVSALVEGTLHTCQVRYIPLRSMHLGRVEAVNALSRRIASGEAGPEAAREELERICAMGETRDSVQILASGCSSACFCFLFGGAVQDCALAFAAGLLLYFFLRKICVRITAQKGMTHILCSALATLFCCAAWRALPGLDLHLDQMIIGAVVPLVPGVPLAMAARNFMENDYTAGLVRATDAVLVAGCIAVGVGSVLMVWNAVLGGVVL